MPRHDPWARRAEAWVSSWWRGGGGTAGVVLSVLLWPAEQLYRGVVAVRNQGYEWGLLGAVQAGLPVICVGNLGVGGSGKTPIAAWLADRLERRGERPAIVLRGYGRDEILVHQEINPRVPVIAAKRRLDGVVRAARNGCTVVVLDDGFQHRSLARDLDIVLVPVESWTEPRPRLLPRGPWREPLTAARRADLVIVTRKSAPAEVMARVMNQIQSAVASTPVTQCDIVPGALVELNTGMPASAGVLSGRSVLAISTLAQPGPFVANLVQMGMQPEACSYPDHYEFTGRDIVELLERAGSRPIVVTLKEAVKLRALLPPGVLAYVLRQEVRPGEGMERLLEASLRRVLGE
jgi:tetraacyldisaccharide 4'-kinase